MQYGNVLGLGVSVLPATSAYLISSHLHVANFGLEIIGAAGVWAVSYLGINTIVRYIRK